MESTKQRSWFGRTNIIPWSWKPGIYSNHLVHWLSITQFLRRISPESINLERKSNLDCFSDTHCTRVEFGRVTYWFCRPWGVGDDGRIGNLLEKTRCERGDISPKRRFYFSSRRYTNQTFWRRSGPENIHLGTASTNSMRKSKRFCWRITRVSTYYTSRLTSGCRWSDKWFLVHVTKLHIQPSRWTQSRTLLAEVRIIPYSTEVHWRYQNFSYEFGCQARKPHRWLLEYRWITRLVRFLDRFHTIYSIGRKTSRRINVVREETDKTASDIQARSFMARTLDEIGKKCPAEGEAKVVTWKAKTR